MEIETTTEVMPYSCACGNNLWALHIGYRSDGKTFLIIACSNASCVEQLREELGVNDDQLVTWGEFDITGQGLDPADLQAACLDPKEVN